jgi:hypothetical protein
MPIHHSHQINKPASQSDVGYVTDPNLIRSFNHKTCAKGTEKLCVQNFSDSSLVRGRFLQFPFLAYIAAHAVGKPDFPPSLVGLESGESRKTDTECRSHLFDVLSVSLPTWAEPVCSTNLTGSTPEVQLVRQLEVLWLPTQSAQPAHLLSIVIPDFFFNHANCVLKRPISA